jgi:hypothetical protein
MFNPNPNIHNHIAQEIIHKITYRYKINYSMNKY